MSRLTRFIFITLSMAAVAAAGRVKADDFASRMFGAMPPTPASRACFVRHYDAEHLGRHPRQNVKDLMILVGLQPIEGEKTTNYAFQLSAHFVKLAARMESGGSCGDAKGDHIACGVDCDGGGITIRPSVDGKVVTASAERIRVWRAGTSPEETAQDLDVGGDDKVFRLERADLSECSPLLPKAERVKRLRRK
jgi:hypothetical protein